MTLRRRKSRKAQAADMVGNYLKLKAAGKAAKGAKKTAKGGYEAAKRSPVKTLPLIVAGVVSAAAAVFVATKAIKGGGGEEPAAA
jgi:hypothetical protein